MSDCSDSNAVVLSLSSRRTQNSSVHSAVPSGSSATSIRTSSASIWSCWSVNGLGWGWPAFVVPVAATATTGPDPQRSAAGDHDRDAGANVHTCRYLPLRLKHAKVLIRRVTAHKRPIRRFSSKLKTSRHFSLSFSPGAPLLAVRSRTTSPSESIRSDLSRVPIGCGRLRITTCRERRTLRRRGRGRR